VGLQLEFDFAIRICVWLERPERREPPAVRILDHMSGSVRSPRRPASRVQSGGHARPGRRGRIGRDEPQPIGRREPAAPEID